MRAIFLLSILFLAACSPYASQIKQLDRAYTAGQINADTYWRSRSQLISADAQWRANAAANMQVAAANIQAQSLSYQETLRQQQSVNAYNARTQVLAQPQQVNVYHGGTIRHNVYSY
jgi:hypothetical protein